MEIQNTEKSDAFVREVLRKSFELYKTKVQAIVSIYNYSIRGLGEEVERSFYIRWFNRYMAKLEVILFKEELTLKAEDIEFYKLMSVGIELAEPKYKPMNAMEYEKLIRKEIKFQYFLKMTEFLRLKILDINEKIARKNKDKVPHSFNDNNRLVKLLIQADFIQFGHGKYLLEILKGKRTNKKKIIWYGTQTELICFVKISIGMNFINIDGFNDYFDFIIKFFEKPQEEGRESTLYIKGVLRASAQQIPDYSKMKELFKNNFDINPAIYLDK